MSRRIFRTAGGKRRRFIVGPMLLVGLVALIAAGVAQAVHDDNLFELGPAQNADILSDGNAANGPDWAATTTTPPNGIFDGNRDPVGLEEFGGAAAAFLFDDTSQKGASDRTTFSGAGGSNKNNDPISDADCAARTPPLTGSACDTWHWDSGNVPAKDDLVNVYAYAKVNPADGHLIIYSGFERLDPNGDSHIDIEFLKDQVNLDEAIPCNDPGPDATPCSFTGIRSVGDTIVSMDFVQGGGIGSISVHEWDGTEYIQIGLSGGEGCNATDTICAFNNGSAINGGPWPNFDKTGNEITNIAPNGFTEFGVDVTALEGETPCVSTIAGHTRSSQSFTAELKDFAGPTSFPICGAAISIGPDDVNEVGQSHTFTVTASKTIGGALSAAPDGTLVDVDLTDANGAVNTISDNTCDDQGPLPHGTVNGTCTITFTSNSPGTVTGHAAADVVFGGETFHVETDASGSNSGDAVKRFVDAKILIGPDDVNSIGESHTFTVTVQQNDGLPANQGGGDAASGFGPAPNGTIVDVDLTDAGGAVNTVTANTCDNQGPGQIGTSGGTCSITFTSNTAGTVTGHAEVTFSVGGVSLTRATDATGNNSGDAEKEFVDGSIAWTKRDNAGRLQGGATFRVCRTHNLDTSNGTFVDIDPDVCVTVEDDTDPGPDTSLDEDPGPGQFLLSGLRLGRYTVKETIAPPGYEPDPDTVTVELTLANPDQTIGTAFVNVRPIVKITGFGYTNAATGTPTDGVVSGTATYSVDLHNYGGAATTLSNSSLAVSATGAGAGTLTCAPPSPVAITGTLAAGGDLNPAFADVVCQYSNMADGAEITAVLNVKYTTNTLERTASGSPATITFTVQAD